MILIKGVVFPVFILPRSAICEVVSADRDGHEIHRLFRNVGQHPIVEVVVPEGTETIVERIEDISLIEEGPRELERRIIDERRKQLGA